MRRLGLAVLLVTTVLMTACGDLVSLHSLYTAQDRVFDPALEGKWETDNKRLLMAPNGDAHKAMLQDKHDPSDAARYEVHLVDIKGVRFADLRQEDTIGHMFVRVRVGNGQLRLAFLDTKWLRDRIPHEDADVGAGNTRAVLTAPTPKLRELVGRFAAEPRAYDDDLVFRQSQ